MNSRRRNIPEDRPTISRRNTRSKTSLYRIENSLPIPIDLIVEIFSRLTKKSIARCRCVSKLWASVLRRQDFTDLFFKKSSSRPQLLFRVANKNGYVFFTSNQFQNPDENNSYTVVANRLELCPSSTEILGHINGFLFLRGERILEGRKREVKVLVIYNPTTGQSLQLPKMKTRRRFGLKSYFGYDPIEKKFKVLSMTFGVGNKDGICEEFQVLTLGNGKPSWRMIECCIPHYPAYTGICLNGVLYYLASFEAYSEDTMIVCFDFGSEKFSSMKIMEIFSRPIPCSTKLINYNGKLGLLFSQGVYVDGRSRSFEMWVLEDAEKHEWSKHSLWNDVIAETKLCFVGMIGTNEIVLEPVCPCVPSYIVYYNTERKTILRVEIQGMEACKGKIFHTFLNHVENVELIQAV